ncbi:MAG: polysaccharide pyruvyl transferase family protein [Marmoricola sp.]
MARSAQTTVLARRARHTVRRIRHQGASPHVRLVKELGEQLSARPQTSSWAGPEHLRVLREQYRPAPGLDLVDGRVPLVWWTDTPNFGDLLSPWLVGRMSERPVVFAPPRGPSHVAVGSVVTRARAGSVVWGSGSFGTERQSLFSTSADYRAVRGPLTRSRLHDLGIHCPPVYGDPALLVPLWYWPEVERTHDVGIVIRHSEHRWRDLDQDDSVKVIDFGSSDIETVLREILSCRRIISSSLHGLVIADAYGIPNAWLGTEGRVGGSRPNGGEFKYLDYFASVNKLRQPHHVDLSTGSWTSESIAATFSFDDRPIEIDLQALLDASPFVTRR